MADFQKTLQQRDSETQRTKVSCELLTLYLHSLNAVTISVEKLLFHPPFSDPLTLIHVEQAQNLD